MNQPIQLDLNTTYYLLILNGGIGARIISSAFIATLQKLRKLDNNHSAPIIIVDNAIVGPMCSESMKTQNIHHITINDNPNSWPHHPSLLKDENGNVEHPVWLKSYRDLYKTENKNLHDIIRNNWDRCYSIDYCFSLDKLLHQHRLKKSKESFVAYHYGKIASLEYLGNTPMLKVTQYNKELDSFIKGLSRPYILCHLGVDLNDGDMMSPINYRFFKTFSIARWAEIVAKLGNKYEFVQVYANKFNVDIPGMKSVKVTDLNPVLQLMENKKCAFTLSIDNYLHHLSAAIKKPSLVLWTSTSPHVWGWAQQWHGTPHFHITNQYSCPEIYCRRPGTGDIDANSRNWMCPFEYNCGQSISVDQVLREVKKVEAHIEENKNSNQITF